jgi:hypothetical protein
LRRVTFLKSASIRFFAHVWRALVAGGSGADHIMDWGLAMVLRKVCVAPGCDDLALVGLAHCEDHDAKR